MCFVSKDGLDFASGKSFKIDLKDLYLLVKTKSHGERKLLFSYWSHLLFSMKMNVYICIYTSRAYKERKKKYQYSVQK